MEYTIQRLNMTARSQIIFERALIFLVGLLPPLLVLPGKIFDQYSFTLYREPKLYLIGALAWLLAAAGYPRKSVVALGLLGMSLISFFSLLWAPVKEAVIYEVFQYINLALLAAVLAYYFRQKQGRRLFLCCLFTAMAVVVFIGLFQWQGVHFPMLIPVRIAYPSTFGARHSAGLAMCGAIFLTLTPLSYFLKNKKYLACLFLIVLFSLQLFIS